MVNVEGIEDLVFTQTMIGRNVVIDFTEKFSRGPDAAAQRANVSPSIRHQNQESIREP